MLLAARWGPAGSCPHGPGRLLVTGVGSAGLAGPARGTPMQVLSEEGPLKRRQDRGPVTWAAGHRQGPGVTPEAAAVDRSLLKERRQEVHMGSETLGGLRGAGAGRRQGWPSRPQSAWVGSPNLSALTHAAGLTTSSRLFHKAAVLPCCFLTAGGAETS